MPAHSKPVKSKRKSSPAHLLKTHSRPKLKSKQRIVQPRSSWKNLATAEAIADSPQQRSWIRRNSIFSRRQAPHRGRLSRRTHIRVGRRNRQTAHGHQVGRKVSARLDVFSCYSGLENAVCISQAHVPD